MRLQECNLPPPPPLTEYEKQRLVRVKQNNEIYFALNLPTLSAEVRSSFSKNKGKGQEKVQEGSDKEYDPTEDNEAGSNADGSGTQVKVRHTAISTAQYNYFLVKCKIASTCPLNILTRNITLVPNLLYFRNKKLRRARSLLDVHRQLVHEPILLHPISKQLRMQLRRNNNQ